MKFRTIVSNPALLNLGRRIVFSLLAVWVHFAVLFYITMILFSHGESSPKNLADSLKRERKIEVSLKQTPPPQTDTAKPDPQAAEIKQKDNPQPPKAPETPPEPSHPNEEASSEGILNCDTLTTKPRMIASGEGFMQLKNIDTTTGSITLREKIHRDGTVFDVVVENSTMSKKMEEQVLNSAYHAVFAPGKMGDVPVDCTIRFQVKSDAP